MPSPTSPLFFTSFNFDVNPNTGLAKFLNPVVELQKQKHSCKFDKVDPEKWHLLHCGWESAVLEAKCLYGWSPQTLLKWRVKNLCYLLHHMIAEASKQESKRNTQRSIYFVWSWLSCHAHMWCHELGSLTESRTDRKLPDSKLPRLYNALNVNRLADMFGLSMAVLSVFKSKGITNSANCKDLQKSMCHIFMKAAPTRCVVRDLIIVIEKSISRFPVIASLLNKIFFISIVGGYPNATHRASWNVIQIACKYWGNEEWGMGDEMIKWIKGEYVNDSISYRFVDLKKTEQAKVKLVMQNIIVGMLREYLCFLFEQIPCVKTQFLEIMKLRDPGTCSLVDDCIIYKHMNEVRKLNNDASQASLCLFHHQYVSIFENSQLTTSTHSQVPNISKVQKSIVLSNTEALFFIHTIAMRKVHVCECDPYMLTYPGNPKSVEAMLDNLMAHFNENKLKNISSVCDIFIQFICYIKDNWLSSEIDLHKLNNIDAAVKACRLVKSSLVKSVNFIFDEFDNITHGQFYKEVLFRILSKHLHAQKSCVINLSHEHKYTQWCKMNDLQIPSTPPVVFCDVCFRVRHVKKNKTMKECQRVKYHTKSRFVLCDDFTLRCSINETMGDVQKRYHISGFHNRASVVFLLGKCIQLPSCCIMLCEHCLLPFPVKFGHVSSTFSHMCDSCCTLALKKMKAIQNKKKTNCDICGAHTKKASCSVDIFVYEQFKTAPPVFGKKCVCTSCAWALQIKKYSRQDRYYIVFNDE